MIDLEFIPPFFQKYIRWVDETQVVPLLKKDMDGVLKFFGKIPKEKYNYQYAPGKWTIKEILQHLIDVERVFTYRALRFSRNDPADLPGFDEEYYLEVTSLEQIAYLDLLEEWKAVRTSGILFFKHLDPKFLDRVGRAGGHEFSVRSIGYILAGHSRHHIQIIKERYL